MSTPTPSVPDDVFSGPALPLVLRLESDGFTFKRDGSRVLIRPVHRLTDEDRAGLAEHRAAVLFLVTIALDEEVQRRRDVFKAQVADATPPTLPMLVFKPDVPYVRGRCFSCDVPLPAPRFGRCWACSVAWRLALGMPVPVSLASALDEARIA